MLLIGNGCFGELSLLLHVIMVCVFFHSIYNNTSTGINCPGVSCKYNTYHILLNIYVQLFISILVWLIVIVSYALFRLCIVIFVFVDRLF